MAAKPARTSGGKARKAPAQAQTGGDPSLSRDRIAAAAIAILDAEGLDGLSMRKLADRLGAGVMSLYWHVAGKDALLDLALDAVLAMPETQAAETGTTGRQAAETAAADITGAASRPAQAVQDWRADILAMASDWRAAMLAHPWSAALLPSRALGPNILARLERLASALARAGVPEADINAAIWSVWNHVMGATITRARFAVSDESRAATQARLGDPAAAPREAAQSAPAPSGHHPTISRTRLLMDDDWDGAFRKGLGFLLDGLAPRR